jgi:hypothetical protein
MKINPSTIPGLKPGVCSGLILSGAFDPVLKARVWAVEVSKIVAVVGVVSNISNIFYRRRNRKDSDIVALRICRKEEKAWPARIIAQCGPD